MHRGTEVKIGGTTYGTTAGHCGPNGTVHGAYGWTHANGFPFGGGTGTDAARVTGSTYGPRLYHGGTGTTSSLAQVGAGDPAGAITVWTSGSRGGSTSGTVTDLSTTFCSGGQCVTGCFSTNNTSTVGGDSGAVVHTASGGNAGVRGTHTGTSGPRQHATKWSTIVSTVGVSILT